MNNIGSSQLLSKGEIFFSGVDTEKLLMFFN